MTGGTDMEVETGDVMMMVVAAVVAAEDAIDGRYDREQGGANLQTSI
jgi:hypothetical protein